MKRAYGFVQVLCWAAVMVTGVNAMSETLAERLGYGEDARLLLLHADDLGMNHSTNQGCIEVLQEGIVKSGSVMVPCPWFGEMAEFARDHPEHCIGLHLTHTAEWQHYRWGPVAGHTQVPGLVDENGFFFRGVNEVVANASPKEIETEIRAQIEKALRYGMKPTHLDSHMGTLFADIDFLKTALRLAEEYDLPFMFFRPTPTMMERAGDRFPVELSKELEAKGWPLLDGLKSIPGDTPVADYADAYMKLIAELPPGVWEVILHPAKASQEMRATTGSWLRRDAEYRVFTSPEMRDFIQAQDVHVISWKDLHPVWAEREPVRLEN